ncbi:MAG: penicillin-binding transpeptidase domain-containing protein [Actinomycetota bacterium]
MDRRIRQVAGLITMLILAVTVSAGWIQGIKNEEIGANEPEVNGQVARNQFRIYQECRWERGRILSIDGQTLAESVRAPAGRRCLYERRYPEEELAAHIVGNVSLYYPKSGLEAEYNGSLVGEAAPAEDWGDLFEKRPRIGNTVISTIDTRLQREALKALDGRNGGVVAMNPKTGAVYVAASNPSYDPNPLSSHNRQVAEAAYCELGQGYQKLSDGTERKDENGERVRCENPAAPLTSAALASRRPPGSTFKVVTAAAALESGKYNPDTQTKGGASYVPPGESSRFPINNYGAGSCGGTLANALRVSCNTSFAQIAVDVGAERLYSTAAAMGLTQGTEEDSFIGCESGKSSDIGGTRTACLPREFRSGDRVESLETAGFRARAGFGQWVIQASPYGMAQVAATVANGGFVPKPRFAERVIDRRGDVVEEVRTGIGASALAPEAASQLAGMMRGVVTGGTASGAFGGFKVPAAGKTGTADQPTCAADEEAVFGAGCERLAHAWFMAFAPYEDPTIAIAVLIERGGGRAQATGGRVAAPVARQVLDAFFKLYPALAGGKD